MLRRFGYDGLSIKPVEAAISKTYLPYDPDQQLLLPAALQEWLPDDHLAYFISDVVDQLDPRLREGRLCRRSRRVTSRKGEAGHPTIPG